MAIYVYRLSDGSLYSTCPNDTDPVAPANVLAANGLGAVSGLPPLGPTISWNPLTKTTMVTIATTPVTAPPFVGTIMLNGVTYTVSGTTQ